MWNAEAKLHSTNQVLHATLAMEENSSSIITRSPVVSITLDSIVSVKLTTIIVFGSRCTDEPIVTVEMVLRLILTTPETNLTRTTNLKKPCCRDLFWICVPLSFTQAESSTWTITTQVHWFSWNAYAKVYLQEEPVAGTEVCFQYPCSLRIQKQRKKREAQ